MRSTLGMVIGIVVVALAAWTALVVVGPEGNPVQTWTRDYLESFLSGDGAETQEARPATPAMERMTPFDRFVEANGVRFRVREEGPADAPVIVMIHGYSFSLESFDSWAARFADRYRVVRFDLPGHALTGPDPQGRYSNEDTVALTAALFDELKLDEMIVMGNSLGGLVAWRYAVAHPDRVRGLVLVDAGAFPNRGVTEEPAPVPAAVKMYLRMAPEMGVRQATGALFGDPSKLERERVLEIQAYMQEPGVADALIARVETFTLPDPTADLAKIQAPTLVVWGEEDAFIPVAHAAMIAEAVPDADVATLPGVGHMPQEEAPARSAAIVDAWLAGRGLGVGDATPAAAE